MKKICVVALLLCMVVVGCGKTAEPTTVNNTEIISSEQVSSEQINSESTTAEICGTEPKTESAKRIETPIIKIEITPPNSAEYTDKLYTYTVNKVTLENITDYQEITLSGKNIQRNVEYTITLPNEIATEILGYYDSFCKGTLHSTTENFNGLTAKIIVGDKTYEDTEDNHYQEVISLEKIIFDKFN